MGYAQREKIQGPYKSNTMMLGPRPIKGDEYNAPKAGPNRHERRAGIVFAARGPWDPEEQRQYRKMMAGFQERADALVMKVQAFLASPLRHTKNREKKERA